MIKLGSSLLLIALTAGLTVLAVNGGRHPAQEAGPEGQTQDVDAWFI